MPWLSEFRDYAILFTVFVSVYSRAKFICEMISYYFNIYLTMILLLYILKRYLSLKFYFTYSKLTNYMNKIKINILVSLRFKIEIYIYAYVRNIITNRNPLHKE